MRKLIKPIASMLFSYVRVFDKEGKLVGSEPILRNTCELRLSKYIAIAEDITSLVLRVDKRGQRKLKNGVIVLDKGDSIMRIPLSGIDLEKPNILSELEQYSEPVPNLFQCFTNDQTFCFDEDWLKENQEEFNNLMLGKS
jgi:hypothetical protein